jgi:hypothetical protein
MSAGPEDDIPPPLRALLMALKGLGMPVSVQILRIPASGAAAQPAAAPEPCTLPYSACPACHGELCFGEKNEADLTGVCSSCGALITSVREPLPRAVRLLTGDELLALPAEEHMALMRAHQHVVSRLAPSKGEH